MKEHLPPDTWVAESLPKGWLFLGYVLAVFGGILGILLGLHIVFKKKRTPNGSSFYKYEASDRRQGKYIIVLGCMALAFSLIMKWV